VPGGVCVRREIRAYQRLGNCRDSHRASRREAVRVGNTAASLQTIGPSRITGNTNSRIRTDSPREPSGSRPSRQIFPSKNVVSAPSLFQVRYKLVPSQPYKLRAPHPVALAHLSSNYPLGCQPCARLRGDAEFPSLVSRASRSGFCSCSAANPPGR